MSAMSWLLVLEAALTYSRLHVRSSASPDPALLVQVRIERWVRPLVQRHRVDGHNCVLEESLFLHTILVRHEDLDNVSISPGTTANLNDSR